MRHYRRSKIKDKRKLSGRSVASSIARFDSSLLIEPLERLVGRVYWKDVERQFTGFGQWRHEIQTNQTPDWRGTLFHKRRFTGRHFECA